MVAVKVAMVVCMLIHYCCFIFGWSICCFWGDVHPVSMDCIRAWATFLSCMAYLHVRVPPCTAEVHLVLLAYHPHGPML
jgi:hypothetical protein